MKTKGRIEHQTEHDQERGDSVEFHSKRMRRERKIEHKKEASIQPEGNYEYEQLVAEDANFNTKPMIEKAAYFLAEHRGFAAGNEVSDWLQAEAAVECLLRGVQFERRSTVIKDRREMLNLSNRPRSTVCHCC